MCPSQPFLRNESASRAMAVALVTSHTTCTHSGGGWANGLLGPRRSVGWSWSVGERYLNVWRPSLERKVSGKLTQRLHWRVEVEAWPAD